MFEPAERGTRKVIISTNIAEVRGYESTRDHVLTISMPTGERDYRRHQIRRRLGVCQGRSNAKGVSMYYKHRVQIRTYNPSTAMSSLTTTPISQASATQRAGRAGRTAPGVCYRLYTEHAFQQLRVTSPPEITRTDLTTPILQLKSLGIDDLMKFEWVSSPPAESVLRALEGLAHAGMVGEDGRLTVVGEKVAECPVEVNIARMVRSAVYLSQIIAPNRLS